MRNRARTAATTGALLLATAVVVGLAVFLASFERSANGGVEQLVDSDLVVDSGTFTRGGLPSLLREDDHDAGLRALVAQFEGNLSRVSKLTGIARSTIRSRLARRVDGASRDITGPARYDHRR